MSFAHLVCQRLKEAKDEFGSYSYYDKGPDEVMSVGELIREFKKLPVEEMISELKLLSTLECELEPSALVQRLLGAVDDSVAYAALFEDEDILEMYDY